MIKYIKIILWSVAKRLSYMEDARCLKVKNQYQQKRQVTMHSILKHKIQIKVINDTLPFVVWQTYQRFR